MRVNVYAEEMTDRVEVIEKSIDGQTFMGIRFYLELPATVNGEQVRGPFVHRPGDDDSSAVTFWGKRDLRVVLRKALDALDAIYGPRGGQPTDAPAAAAPVDTLNRFGIGAGGDGDTLVSLALRRTFTQEEAHNLAAWLVALSGDRQRFEQVLAAVGAS